MKHINLKQDKKKNYSQFRESIKYLPRKEMKLLLETISTTENKHIARNTLIFSLLLSTGCRINEFLHIKVQDLDFDNGLIHIPAENTKTKRARSVRVRKDLLQQLKQYLLHNNIKNGFVFRNPHTLAPLTARRIRDILDFYTKDLNLTFKPSPHTFRHSHCVYALSEGVPINALQKQVGHLSLEVTQIYSDIAGSELLDSYKEVSF
jgi:site-specific recombinase XerD